ncbi:hypothetical protein ACFL27_06530 [candidate division CSSED10-310 bacterium]|uniref:Phosphohydrolase n=1 Tax=candidate division CSSED10-310 bacterium TaxID=2855610 RepID=A0ABV6YUI4_UNCC1
MKCPGQDRRYWQPHDIFEVPCPECGQAVEFFKDDLTRQCSHCDHRLFNPRMDFGCASHCQAADQCLGHQPQTALKKSNFTDNGRNLEKKR